MKQNEMKEIDINKIKEIKSVTPITIILRDKTELTAYNFEFFREEDVENE